MRRINLALAFSFIFVVSSSSQAAVITFDSDPFAGSTALTTPGRQVVGGEPFVEVDPAVDVFAFDPAFFDVSGISFVNDEIANVPATGVNTIVLRTFDNDNDTTTPFGAGNAANLIADQITTAGAGFFIYFNSGLNLPRLVYSTNLDDSTADLKILLRFTNLAGNQAALADFSADNFDLLQVNEPASILLLGVAAALYARHLRAKTRRAPRP
jgi:hypothetical protein